MTNLVFDLSNMFFRSLYIVGGYGSNNFTFDTQAEVDKLMRKVATDISYIIRQTNPSRVLFALDSKSWRKDIDIEENAGYKANRERTEVINWDNVFNTMKEFGTILNSNGFIVTKINKAEADDIMALWRDELVFGQHQHVIMVSSDEDVRQLACAYPFENNKFSFCTIYNPFTAGRNSSKKLFIPKHFNEWLDNVESGDIFNRAIDVDKEDFIRIRDNEQIILEEINGDEIALRKIFCGDDGDNVPAIYSWIAVDKNGDTAINKKTGEPRVDRITPAKFTKIIERINAKDHWDLDKNIKNIYTHLTEISKNEPAFDMATRLDRQKKLVVLDRKIFPTEIVEEFDSIVDEQLKKPNVHPQDWNMNTLLEGTRYVNAKKKGNEASIFNEIDRLSTNSLF